MKRYVYQFKDGSSAMRKLLGLKASRLCEIYRMCLPVPPGIVITTQGCSQYYLRNRSHPPELERELQDKLELLERGLGRKLGCPRDPLLVSVRAGAERQMPGLMDSCCNVGLNDRSVIGLARRTGNERFAWDTYSQFVGDFAAVCMGVDREAFDETKDSLLRSGRIRAQQELSAADFRLLTDEYMHVVSKATGKQFPQNPEEQLWMAIEAVYRSWNYERSIAYRRANDLLWLPGTGVTIQTMVFGNLNDRSGSGRMFSRNPLTGERQLYGEYLMNTQGEHLIGGRAVAPKSIELLQNELPAIYSQLLQYSEQLETHFHDMQDIQFTIQNQQLYILYSKDAKRTPAAGIKVASDMVREHRTKECDAISGILPASYEFLTYKTLAAGKGGELIGKGIPGSLNAAAGVLVFNKKRVEEIRRKFGKPVILVSKECGSEDYVPLTGASGYITQCGGSTSDFAILARDIGKACVLSCEGLRIIPDLESCVIGSRTLREGDAVTIDGRTGKIFAGELPLEEAGLPKDYNRVMGWADIFSRMKIKVNVSKPMEARKSRALGAAGIGTLKTEDTFNDPIRLNLLRRALFAEDPVQRLRYMEELSLLHKEDIVAVLREMDELPCVIRTLDASLHQYIPADVEAQKKIARDLGIPLESIQKKYNKYAELSHTLGLRATRIAVLHPEVLRCQAKAIFLAALELIEQGHPPKICIEFPMISSSTEYLYAKNLVDEMAHKTGVHGRLDYKVGLLVEIPRAALTIDEVAKDIDFVEFGTNDLTQMTCGYSRQDSARFLDQYVKRGLYAKDPFVAIDEKGVGEFMKICIERVKRVNPNVWFAVAGNHAADPGSVEFFSQIGIQELSVAPQKFAVAKIAAAQVGLRHPY